VAEYVWVGDLLVGVLKSHNGTTYQYVETDALGTPRAVINPVTNTTIWRWDLTPSAFGDHAANNDADANGVGYSFNLRYPGQYYNGLDFISYNYYRDYDARTGRYIESDPTGLAGGSSTFGYANANPLALTDPLGLVPGMNNIPEGKAGMVAEALSHARKMLRECKCDCVNKDYCFNQEDRNHLMEALENNNFFFEDEAHPSGDHVLGERAEDLGGSKIYPSAFQSVNILASTLAHESNHRTKGDHWEEPASYYMDEICFNFRHYGDMPKQPRHGRSK
jgi:RHS repeat-associated protein